MISATVRVDHPSYPRQLADGTPPMRLLTLTADSMQARAVQMHLRVVLPQRAVRAFTCRRSSAVTNGDAASTFCNTSDFRAM